MGNSPQDGMYISAPDEYQMYQSEQHIYSAFSMDEQEDKYPIINNEIQEEPQLQDNIDDEDVFIKTFKPGPNGYQEIPLELVQNFFDITELEDQACTSTGRTKFKMVINGQEMIIDGTVTPANDYTPQQQQQTPGELEEELEDSVEYNMMHLPEAVLSGGQSMQMITLPDGQLALQVTQMEQKPQMAQVVTVDEEGNIISTDGTFAIGMPSSTQNQGAVMMTMQTDEFGNMYLQEESAPSTSGVGNFHCMEVTGDPAEIAAMYPGMQMLAVNPDGTLESVFEDGLPAPTAETTYVNAKQYHRIMKRREARARLESTGRVPKIRSKYLHESRHRHACNRVRGEGGKFNSKKGRDGNDITGDEHSPMKIPKFETSPTQDHKEDIFTAEKNEVPLLPRPIFTRPAKTTRIPTPLTVRSTTTSHQRPTAVITHLPLPPQSKVRPPGFRVARPSEIKKLLPTTYSKPGSATSKVELPDKILEESPSNSNSPPYSAETDDISIKKEPDFSNLNSL